MIRVRDGADWKRLPEGGFMACFFLEKTGFKVYIIFSAQSLFLTKETTMSDEIISAEAEQKQLDDIFSQRKAKAEELRAAGIAPYGVFVDNIIPTTEARAKYVPDVENTELVTVAGLSLIHI